MIIFFKFSAEGAVTDATANQFWIGLNNVDLQTQFVWDGSRGGIALSYTDWHTSNPVLNSPNTCGLIAQRNGGLNRWINSNCFDVSARFICEVPEPCRTVLRA
jgi:hypothetical protein